LGKSEVIFHNYNENSVLVSWNENTIDIIPQRSAFEMEVKKVFPDVIVNHGAYSILLLWKKKIHHSSVIDRLKKLLIDIKTYEANGISWRLPIYYELENELVDSLSEFSKVEIISKHQETIFTVDFIGFLPGFPYLKGLDSSLQLPRKSTPALQVAAGTVAISNEYCGIYPSQSPAGWHVLGNCPLPMFDIRNDQPSLLVAGDRVQFYAISKEEHSSMKNQIANESLTLKSFHIDG
jgi:KipI family sensor histidine kinase inhibitor